VTEFADDRSQRLLAEAEVLVTGWGAPVIDAAVLARAPRLRLVVHAAGTIKGLVDESVFDAGVKVSHAAEANAVPVAEFTLAAVIFAGKQVFRFRDVYAADRGRERTQISSGRGDRKPSPHRGDRRRIPDRAPRDRAAASPRPSTAAL
jgi:phosphoglycerate dehydrogenase-like enzyme